MIFGKVVWCGLISRISSCLVRLTSSALKASIVAITADRAHARGDGPQRQDCERQDEDQGRAHFSSDGAARPSAMSRRPSTRPNARIIAGQSIRAILVAPIFAHTSAGTA